MRHGAGQINLCFIIITKHTIENVEYVAKNDTAGRRWRIVEVEVSVVEWNYDWILEDTFIQFEIFQSYDPSYRAN